MVSSLISPARLGKNSPSSVFDFSGALAPRAADIVVFAAVALRNLVKHFNQDGEADSGVEVAFRDVEMEGFGNEAETDHQQETQAEHDDGRMPVHELGQRFAGGNRSGGQLRTYCGRATNCKKKIVLLE